MKTDPQMTMEEWTKNWLELKQCSNTELNDRWDAYEELMEESAGDDRTYYRQMWAMVVAEYQARGGEVEITPPKKS
jgi:hypothetical protein